MSNLQPWQPLNPAVNWHQPSSPAYVPPMFGNQPQLSLYQPIYSPPAQVVVVQERRRGSGLEGLAVLALLFLGSRALRTWANEREQIRRSSAPVFEDNRRMSTTSGPIRDSDTWVQPTPVFTTPEAVFGDGMFLVGTDIEPGTYRTNGRAGESLLWVRSSDASGEAGSILASYRGIGSRHYVTLKAGEYFRSERSGGWALVSRL